MGLLKLLSPRNAWRVACCLTAVYLILAPLVNTDQPIGNMRHVDATLDTILRQGPWWQLLPEGMQPS